MNKFQEYQFSALNSLRHYVARECNVNPMLLEESLSHATNEYARFVISNLLNLNSYEVQVPNPITKKYYEIYQKYDIDKVFEIASFVSDLRERDLSKLQFDHTEIYDALLRKTLDKRILETFGFSACNSGSLEKYIELRVNLSAKLENWTAKFHIPYTESKSVNYYSFGVSLQSNLHPDTQLTLDLDNMCFPMRLLGVSDMTRKNTKSNLGIIRGVESISVFQQLLLTKVFLDKISILADKKFAGTSRPRFTREGSD